MELQLGVCAASTTAAAHHSIAAGIKIIENTPQAPSEHGRQLQMVRRGGAGWGGTWRVLPSFPPLHHRYAPLLAWEYCGGIPLGFPCGGGVEQQHTAAAVHSRTYVWRSSARCRRLRSTTHTSSPDSLHSVIIPPLRRGEGGAAEGGTKWGGGSWSGITVVGSVGRGWEGWR